MQLVDPEILTNFLAEPAPGFEQAFDLMRLPIKEDWRAFLVYVDKILNLYLHRPIDKEELGYIHLHFPDIAEDIKGALLEFLVIRMFNRSMAQDEQVEEFVQQQIEALNTQLSRNIVPAEAKAANGGNLAYKHWQATRARIKEEITFLRSIPPQKGLRPETVINLLNNDLPALEGSLYALSIDELKTGGKRAYNILNTDLDLPNTLKALHDTANLAFLRQIIIYDSDGRKNIQSFKWPVLKLLKEKGYALQWLIILSFDKQPFRMRTLINRMSTIHSRYLTVPQQPLRFKNSYVFELEEVDRLLGVKRRVEPVHLIGHHSEFYSDLLFLIEEYGLGKLRSPTVLNVYAMAMNRGLADLIVTDLFGAESSDRLFQEEVRALVKGLDPNEQEKLRDSLKRVLASVVKEWDEIRQRLKIGKGKGSVGIVAPWSVLTNTRFRKELKALFSDRKVDLYTWKDVRDELCHNRYLFLLAYRDPGRYPFDLYPSLLEGRSDAHGLAKPLILELLFGERHRYVLFEYTRVKARILGNEIRYGHFHWKEVESRIEGNRPVRWSDDHEEEEDDEIPDNSEIIKVKYVDGFCASYYPSKPMLIQRDDGAEMTIMRMDEIIKEDEQISIQPLDELYMDLNPFQVTPRDERELQVIKSEYHVSEPDRALWKVLLVKQKELYGDSKRLYEKIESLLDEKEFVQYGYFKDHWLNIDSALLVPRKRRHFRRICDLLELPSAYYRLELKKRASLTNNSRQSTIRMNGLLKQLFQIGLFKSHVDISKMDLRYLVETHDLEEVGIDEENVNGELAALVGMLREKLNLKQVQKIDLL